jgi:PAS domain S-box-containing protein
MEWLYGLVAFLLLLATALTFSVAAYAIRRYRTPGAMAFACLLLSASLWSLAYLFELSSSDTALQVFWFNIKFIGVACIPSAWLVCTAQFTNQRAVLKRGVMILLVLAPALSLGMLWTNELHHLFFSEPRTSAAGGIWLLQLTYGPVFWLEGVFNYSALILGAILLLKNSYFASRPPGWQSEAKAEHGYYIAALAAPLLASLFSVFFLIRSTGLDLTPFSFVISGILLVLAIQQFRFLEVLPRAQQTIIEEMADGLVVLDIDDKIVYANRAACQILDCETSNLRGKHASQALPAWNELVSHPVGTEDYTYSPIEIFLGEAEKRRYYEMHVSPLRNTAGLLTGKLALWQDITLSKQTEQIKRTHQERMFQLVENSPNPIFSIDKEGLIQSWNRACELTFAQGREILGRNYQTILSPAEDQERIKEMVRQVFEEKVTQKDIDIIYRVGRRSTNHMISRLYPLVDEQGAVEACVFANTDITERKIKEQTLRQRLEELTVLHAAATACAEAADEDTLVERITQIIGKYLLGGRGLTLEQVNYGVLLADENRQALRFHPSYRGLIEDIRQMRIASGQGVTGQTVKSGSARLVLDVLQEPEYKELDAKIRSELSVPIKVNEQIFGVINVESAQTGAFNQADEQMLTILAEQLASAIERLRAQAAEQQRIQELVAVARVSEKVSSEFGLQEVLDSIARLAAEISDADASGLWMSRPDGRYGLTASYGVGAEFIRLAGIEGIEVEGTALGHAMQQRKPYQIPDIVKDPGYSARSLAKLEKIRSILALPMLRGEAVLGGIVLWQRKPRRFTPEEETFLQALANQSVNALENARLLENEREQRRVAEVLRETGTALNAALDFDNVIDQILDQARRLIPYDAANLMIVEEGHARVRRMRGYEAISRELFEEVRKLDLEIKHASNLRVMLETGQPLIIPDVRTFPDWVTQDRRFYLKSWAGAPVIIQNKLSAFFSLEKLEPNFYLPEHAERLAILAGQAGLALQNAHLFEVTQRRLREMGLLSRVIAATSSAKDIPSAATKVCIEVADFFNTRQAIFVQVNADTMEGEIIAQYPLKGGASIIGLQIKVGNLTPLKEALGARAAVAIQNVEEEPLLGPVQEFLKQFSVASVIIIAIFLNGRIAGVLGIGTSERRNFSQVEMELVQDISRQLSQSLERLWLFTTVQEQAERMSQLAQLAGELNRPLTMHQVIEGIGHGAMALAKAERAALYIRLNDQSATCAWWQGLSEQYRTQVIVQLQHVPGGQLLQRTEPVLIPDVLALPESSPLRRLAIPEGFRSLGLWPLVYEGTVIAAVGLYYNEPNPWPKNLQEHLRAFVPQAAVALQNAHLFEEISRRARQQTALNEIIAEAVTAPNLPHLLEIALQQTLRALNLSMGSFSVSGYQVHSGISQALDVQQIQRLLAAHKAWPARPDLPPACLVIETRAPVSEQDPLAGWKAQMAKLGIHAILQAPIIVRGKSIGALSLIATEPRKWLPEELALAEAVSKQVGSASERLDLLEAARQQALQVQQIIDTVPEGVLLLDRELQIVLANPAAEQFLPVLLQTGSSKNDRLSHLGNQTLDVLLNAEPERLWNELLSADPPQRIFEAAARPVQLEREQSGWVIVLREVTEEREEQNRVQIRERLATVGQLAAGIAHDFNNIMAAILIYTDLLVMEPGLSPTSRERLEIIQSQIQRATSLIRQILDFSRRAVMDRVVLDILPLIKELDKLLERVLPENIRLNLIYRPGTYLVKADPTHLQQAFMNLALNARDAMPDGGALQILLDRVVLHPEDRQLPSELAPGEWIRISVRDSGSGIATDVLPHIFDPFYTTKPVGKGTGLGLAQVYGIIQSHGGAIDVRSQVGQGATFSIYLPAFRNPPEPLPETAPEGEIHGRGETILVAEDDLLALEAIEALLKRHNYAVLCAKNGSDAVRLYEQDPQAIDLVICDVVMPEIGGVQLYQILHQKNPALKFLFITGHPLDPQDQVLLEEGRVQWLQKPFSVGQLTMVLSQMLNAGQSSRA